MTQELSEALRRAVDFLAGEQGADGAWRDYTLPVGQSDSWITAYVGLAVSEMLHIVPSTRLRVMRRRASLWIQGARCSRVGWGFNQRTEPDADSTAQAVLLLASEGVGCPAEQVWLEGRFQSTGGCATFSGEDAWALPHPCVTPLAYMALTGRQRKMLRQATLGFVVRMQQRDGTWPSYWWNSCHYSTFWNLRLLHVLGSKAEVALWVHVPDFRDAPMPTSAFDLANLIGSLVLIHGWTNELGTLVDVLLSHQEPNGGWRGGPNLRVTDPSCARPWLRPLGKTYVDHRGAMTTATVVRTIGLLMRSRRDAS